MTKLQVTTAKRISYVLYDGSRVTIESTHPRGRIRIIRGEDCPNKRLVRYCECERCRPS